MFCGVCGGRAAVSHAIRGEQSAHHTYNSCNRGCRGVSFRADRLQEWLVEQLRARLFPPEAAGYLPEIVAAWNAHQAGETDGQATLISERERLLARRGRIEDELLDGVMSRERARARLAETEAALVAVDVRLAAVPSVPVLSVADAALLLTDGWLARREEAPAVVAQAARAFLGGVKLYPKPRAPEALWTPLGDWLAFAPFFMERRARGSH